MAVERDVVQQIFQIETGQAERKLGKLVMEERTLSKAGMQVTSTYRKRDGTMTSVTKNVENLTNKQKSLRRSDERLIRTNKELKHGFLGTGDHLGKIIAKVTTWTVATGAIFGTLSALREGLRTITEFDSKMVGLQKVFVGGRSELALLKDEILDTSIAMGSLQGETIDAAIELGRMGKDRADIAELMRVSLLSQNIAEIEAADATKLLNAAILQFEKQATDAIEILDKWNTLSNTTPVETRALAEAVSIAGSVFHNAGGEIEDLNAWVSTLTATMAKSGAEIGTALRTIASYAYRQRTMAKITEITGIVVKDMYGNLMDVDELLPKIASKWQSLTEAEREELAQSMAGVRRKGFFLNLMNNFDLVLENQIKQWKASGSAIRENEIRLSSLATKTKQLKAALEKLAISGGDTGLILPAFKGMTGILTDFVYNLSEANAGLQLLSGAAGIGFVLMLRKWTAGVKLLSATWSKWMLSITAFIAVFEVVTNLFTIRARALRRARQEAQEHISTIQTEISTQKSLIAAYETIRTLYSDYLNLRMRGKDTAQAEERLKRALSAVNEIMPGIVSSVEDYAEAIDEVGNAVGRAEQRIAILTRSKMVEQLTLSQATIPKLKKNVKDAIDDLERRVEYLDTNIRNPRVMTLSVPDDIKKALGDINDLTDLRDKKLKESNYTVTEEIRLMNNVIAAQQALNKEVKGEKKLRQDMLGTVQPIVPVYGQPESDIQPPLRPTKPPLRPPVMGRPTPVPSLTDEAIAEEERRYELALARLESKEQELKVMKRQAEEMDESIEKVKALHNYDLAKKKYDQEKEAADKKHADNLEEAAESESNRLKLALAKLDSEEEYLKEMKRQAQAMDEGIEKDRAMNAYALAKLKYAKEQEAADKKSLENSEKEAEQFATALQNEQQRHDLAIARMDGTEAYIGALKTILQDKWNISETEQLINDKTGTELATVKENLENKNDLLAIEKIINEIIELRLGLKKKENEESDRAEELAQSKKKRAKELAQSKLKRTGQSVGRTIGGSIRDSMILSVTEGATEMQKNQVWNRAGQRIGQTIGDLASKKITTSITEAGGSALLSGFVGPVAGGLISGAIGMLAQSFFAVDEPVNENLDALDDNTRSIRALNETMQDFKEQFINAPSTFALSGFSTQNFSMNPSPGGGGGSVNVNINGGNTQEVFDTVSAAINSGYNRGERFSTAP